MFAEALAEAGDDRLLRIELLCDLAYASLLEGDIPAGAERARAALDLAHGPGDVPPLILLTPLVTTALCDFLLGRGVRSDLLEEAIGIEEWAAREAVALRPGYLHLPHIPATILKWADDLDTARSRYALAYTRMGERGDESWRPWLLYQMSELECRAGNWEEAGRLAERACESAGGPASGESGASCSTPGRWWRRAEVTWAPPGAAPRRVWRRQRRRARSTPPR